MDGRGDEYPRRPSTMHDEDLRLATVEDANAIRALTRDAYAKWVPVIGREPLPMTVDYAEAVRAHRFDLLHREGRLVALIETVAHPDHLFVENLAVSPSFHGQGLGRHLLAHAEQVAIALGHREVRLLTNAAFDGNVWFYRGAGYAVDREEPFRGGTAVYLSKRI